MQLEKHLLKGSVIWRRLRIGRFVFSHKRTEEPNHALVSDGKKWWGGSYRYYVNVVILGHDLGFQINRRR